ncbi:mitochondrial import inner membrane translocase subunit tim13 [Ascobolus immersus RN42]|uniref:Mitochondrial import inner membrane translocase subunit n=1 Tax=Ascobolus immersus RN42 TaxID=1160509 RepID=A0A3N4J126_ASCIM|nr:mitochondrial import inner membrane translocase subunit tim13 [Ascobolus immersus RN42]
MDMFKGIAGGNSAPVSSQEEKKKALMERIAQEQSIANARALVAKINENCFDKCIPKPGSKMSSSDESCVTKCLEKYMTVWNTVSSEYIKRIQTERNNFQ